MYVYIHVLLTVPSWLYDRHPCLVMGSSACKSEITSRLEPSAKLNAAGLYIGIDIWKCQSYD